MSTSYLRVALAQELGDPFIGHAPGAQASRIRRSEIVNPEVRNSRLPKRRRPDLLETGLIAGRVVWVGKQVRPRPRDRDLFSERFNCELCQRYLGNSTRSLRIRNLDECISQVHVLLLHRGELLIYPQVRFRDDTDHVAQVIRSGGLDLFLLRPRKRGPAPGLI